MVRIGILPFLGTRQIGAVLAAVAERQALGIGFERDRGFRKRKMLGAERRFEQQLARRTAERGDRDRVAEYVVHPPHLLRRRRDRQGRVEEPQVVTVPRPRHEPMLAELDRIFETVLGAVADEQNGHWESDRPALGCAIGTSRTCRAELRAEQLEQRMFIPVEDSRHRGPRSHLDER